MINPFIFFSFLNRYLGYKGLSSSIPPEIGNLSNLTYL